MARLHGFFRSVNVTHQPDGSCIKDELVRGEILRRRCSGGLGRGLRVGSTCFGAVGLPTLVKRGIQGQVGSPIQGFEIVTGLGAWKAPLC